MRRWGRAVAVWGLLAAALAAPGRPESASAGPAPGLLPLQLSAQDAALYRTAFAAAQVNAWTEVRALTTRADSQLPAKILAWLHYGEPGTNASFADIAGFLDANPDWPLGDALVRNAEAAAPGDRSSLDWFARHPPVTGPGMVRFAEGLQAAGRADEAMTWVRRAWTEASLPKNVEKEVLARFGRQLTRADHARRLDSLIWLGRAAEARRMLGRVTTEQRALAEARIALSQRAGGVDGAITRVPAELRGDPGLVFERVRWRRRNGDTAGALDMLSTSARGGPVEAWWPEQSVLSRRSLDLGRITDAYRLAADHRQTDPANVAEAEWQAGWIALRYLRDADLAYRHFVQERANVRLPTSIARAAYWSARAATSLGDAGGAETWYGEAARYPTTFYGQLALQALPGAPTLALPADPAPTVDEARALAANEMAQAAVVLAQLGEQDRLRPFLLRLADQAETDGEQLLVANLARSLDRADLAVAVAKRAHRDGTLLASAGYPVLPLPLSGGAEPALVLAVMRQESEFNPRAVSPAGARGLMQLMPATARSTAAAAQLGYDGGLLLADAGYNVRLGSFHLAALVDDFDGSYLLAVAAYNAGAPRVRQWLREYGDPRDRAVDPIDWIESLPFAETRSYVQRVLENLQVYREVLAGRPTRVTLAEDLRR